MSNNPEQNKRYRERLKREVFSHYGGVCAICREDRLRYLSIDHTKGGGGKHRKAVNAHGGYPFYLWLRRNDYPPDFRVLCHNCNQGGEE